MPDQNHLTPTDFAPHLLVVLAEMANYQPNISVPMRDTYKPVCARMGIDENYGGETRHGSYFTHRQIGLAMRQQIRDKQLGDYAKKGHWMLTAAGISEAKKISGASSSQVEEETVSQEFKAEFEAEFEAARTQANQNAEDDTVATSDDDNLVHLPAQNQKHPYSDDPYIRSLAIEAVRCFGTFSNRSEECKNCPISQDCLRHVGVLKAQIASDLEKEEKRAREEAAKRAREAQKKDKSVAELINEFGNDGEQARSAPNGKFKIPAGTAHHSATPRRPTLCLQCSETIETEATWVKEQGMFHPECVEMPDE